jgi:hypothetical protein
MINDKKWKNIPFRNKQTIRKCPKCGSPVKQWDSDRAGRMVIIKYVCTDDACDFRCIGEE